jgi:hypothetical protein
VISRRDERGTESLIHERLDLDSSQSTPSTYHTPHRPHMSLKKKASAHIMATPNPRRQHDHLVAEEKLPPAVAGDNARTPAEQGLLGPAGFQREKQEVEEEEDLEERHTELEATQPRMIARNHAFLCFVTTEFQRMTLQHGLRQVS